MSRLDGLRYMLGIPVVIDPRMPAGMIVVMRAPTVPPGYKLDPNAPGLLVPIKPIPRDADVTNGYVVAWRAWKVSDELEPEAPPLSAAILGGHELNEAQQLITRSHPALASVTRRVLWPVREALEAEGCGCMTHMLLEGSFNPSASARAPIAGCHCGVYAHKELEHLFRDDEVVPWYIYGPVALWGRAIETERGWKAQYAYPLALFGLKSVHSGYPAPLAELGERYGVPTAVVDLAAIGDVLTWPSVVTSEIREQTGAWVAKGALPAGVRV